MKTSDYAKISSFRGTDAFVAYLGAMGADLPCDADVEAGPAAPLAQPLDVAGLKIGNRFAVNPMEGWDGERDGRATANTTRRWQRFGASGAKLIWGGEAVAVRADGRANPNQLMLTAATQSSIAGLRDALIASHRAACGDADGLVVGLQLTHSGRFCKPESHTRFAPRIAYRHPLLDRKFGQPDDTAVMTDGEVRGLVDAFVDAAILARDCGFEFVDIKHCHGYLAHEFLSAVDRPGSYGGSLENRSRFLREIVAGIRARAPGLVIGIRLSATDMAPFRPDPARSRPDLPGPGVPEDLAGLLPYRFAFGADAGDPVATDPTETFALFEIFRDLGIGFVNLTAGSPYYTPHLIRPAMYPPSDGYQPPEEPLLGVARHLLMARMLKERFPDVTLVSSGLSYLQEFMPNVMQAAVRRGWTDSVGIGRLVLSYPEMPRDVLAGRPLQRKLLCRTFSDCTTAPRNGIVSGCYPLDPYYKRSPEAEMLAQVKEKRKTGG
jgi:NADPH2 dehydrogenase